MLSRRSVLSSLPIIAIALSDAMSQTAAISSSPASSVDELSDAPPNEEGRADFAGAWGIDTPGGIIGLAPAPSIPDGYAESFGSQSFSRFEDIDAFFSTRTGGSFNSWFNHAVAGRDQWIGKRIVGAQIEENFKTFWTQFLDGHSYTLMEFIAYMSVFINECDGNLTPVIERVGSKSHPGLAYPFDQIEFISPTGSKWHKQSYNDRNGALSAYEAFRSAIFVNAHGGLARPKELNPSDTVWKGHVYPQGNIATTTDTAVTGYLQQCDFYKFRGRGLIQTTWRSNYIDLANFIKTYPGTNAVVMSYKQKWSSKSADEICTVSRTEEWDELFLGTNSVIAAEAIRRHAETGAYFFKLDKNHFGLARTSGRLNGNSDGSILKMGDRIGGVGYGTRLKARVYQVCTTLGK